MAQRRQTEAVNKEKSGRINWSTASAMFVFHVLAVVALFNWSWVGFAAIFVLFYISGSLGIGMGYHRLLTHRGYTTPKAVEYFLTVCGALALESGPISWAVT